MRALAGYYRVCDGGGFSPEFTSEFKTVNAV